MHRLNLSLTSEQKAVLRMRVVDGMNDTQIARALHVRREAVSRMQGRVRDKIAKIKSVTLELGGRYDEDQVIRALIGDAKPDRPSAAQAVSAVRAMIAMQAGTPSTEYALTA